MTKSLQKQLAARSEELNLAWCELMPECMHNFLTRSWILLIDDRLPGRRAVVVAPPHMVNNHLPFMLETLRQCAEGPKKKQS